MHRFGAGTHVGNIRDNNEDSFVCDSAKSLFIVADGMGGLGFGEVASAISTYTVTQMVREGQGVNQAIETAHRKIRDYSEQEGKGVNMGTTLVLLLSQGSMYNIFWVGDSRAYLFDKSLQQLTVDHSLVQSLIETGELTPEEAAVDPRKVAITRALGVQEKETVRADSVSNKWSPGQKILLCTDGLSDFVSFADIENVLQRESDNQKAVDELIDRALAGGGRDNITVMVISAPDSVDGQSPDTHVPGDVTESTYIPGSSDTHRKFPDQE
ncbi:MAG: serine/threonine-protein phosphatase [Pseudomonadales bacterium]|nr:serine/threonine-protein phosphatase [Pseudomonadales bacterium]